MRILITGGFGFVGGRLAVHLAQAGHQIILGTRHSMLVPDWLPQANVAKIAWDDEGSLERSCDGVDVVIHAAGMNAQECTDDPAAALAFNGLATTRLVAAANRTGVQYFIYLSTAHVYSNPLVGTITEDTCPRNLHPYATSHLAGEHAVLTASQRGVMRGIVLRLSNVYGAPMHKDVNCWMLLVNDLCRQAVQTHKLVLKTNGLQQRDFIGMTEISRVVEYFIFNYEKSKQVGIFNIGAGVSKSVLDMAKMIQKRCQCLLGYIPLIEKIETSDYEVASPLKYEITKLESIGFLMQSREEEEIDSTLSMCCKEFGIS
jgi:UDP-glucose 4-epimerase